ncbi:MAG: hypothetical protein ACMXX6_01030 [Candidatus Woesearchaeota archaeon]
MARVHFDRFGFPDFNYIIEDINNMLSSYYIKNKDLLLNDDFRVRTFSSEDVPKGFFKLKELYVIGGQAIHLPHNYKIGNHDLDLIILTNAEDIKPGIDLGMIFWYDISNGLNPKGSFDNKKYFVDLHDKNKPEKPYYKVI